MGEDTKCVWCGKRGASLTGDYCSRACIAADPDSNERVAKDKTATMFVWLITAAIVAYCVHSC